MGEKMKKIISILLALVFTSVGSVFAASITKDIDVERSVQARSEFTVRNHNYKPQIQGALIATATLYNNTRDGYRVDIKSLNGAVLKPDSTDNGERDIEYDLEIAVTDGEAPTEITVAGTLTDTDLTPGSDVTIVQISNGADRVNEVSDFKFTVSLDVDDIFKGDLKMAGLHKDTVTLTYTDI